MSKQNKLRSKLAKTLKWLARATIKKFQPEIIGITGTAGKTSTKNAVFAVLAKHWRVRATYANYNTEIGLPMTILGGWQNTGGIWFWLRVIAVSGVRLILPKFLVKYPQILVLEYAADRPGDIKRLLEIARPRIAVLTAIGEIPVHVEFYEDIDGVIREKSRLLEVLPASGGAVLNADDNAVKKLSAKTRAKNLTFGFSAEADIKITRFETKVSPSGIPEGISFKIEYKDAFVPVRITGTLGRPQAYAAAAATCVGIMHNLNIVQISEALSEFSPPKRRMTLVRGIHQSIIIDDSYNSSPVAAAAALTTLADLEFGRKIAVLGDMRELGKYSRSAHENIGKQAAEACDLLITVGPKAEGLGQAAVMAGLEQSKVISFANATMAKDKIASLIKPRDVVLVKGSLSVGLKAVVDELKAQ